MVSYSLVKCLHHALQKMTCNKVMGVVFSSLFICSRGTKHQSGTLQKSKVFNIQKYKLTYTGLLNANIVKVSINNHNTKAPVYGASPSTYSPVTGNSCICCVKGSS